MSMIKKYVTALCFMLSLLLCLIPWPGNAENYSLTEMQIASVLYNEAGGAGKQSMMYVADAIRNRYTEERTKYARYSQGLTYADILFNQRRDRNGRVWDDFENSPAKFANKTADQLNEMGRRWDGGTGKWEQALQIARQVTTNTLPHLTQGSNSFNTTHPRSKSLFYDDATHHGFYWQELGGIKHNPNLLSDDTQANYDTSGVQHGSTPAASQTQTQNSNGAAESGNCLFENMKRIYMEDSQNDDLCWYCNVVIVMTNSFLNAAKNALPSSASLGKVILQWGFIIWLAYYILMQVSSFAPVTPGKMLQEILFMGFKVALAYVAIDSSPQSVIAEYFINPIVGFGLDYGIALYDGLAPA